LDDEIKAKLNPLFLPLALCPSLCETKQKKEKGEEEIRLN
jgi:hypothetical protein